MDTISSFAVHNGGDSIVFIDFLHAGGRKSFFTKFRQVPVSTEVATANMAFDKVTTGIQRRYKALQ